MKKGAIELTDLGEGFYRYRMLAIIDPISKKYVFSKQDLKDLRDCIDEVLGDECAVCNPEWEGKQPIPLCEEHDEEILGQPLTEGEKCECKEMSCKDGCDRKHTCKTFWCEKCKPQESNKEGEPSKKPSERISELSTIMVDDVKHMRDDELEIYEMKVDIDATIQYLDELYESRKDLK